MTLLCSKDKGLTRWSWEVDAVHTIWFPLNRGRDLLHPKPYSLRPKVWNQYSSPLNVTACLRSVTLQPSKDLLDSIKIKLMPCVLISCGVFYRSKLLFGVKCHGVTIQLREGIVCYDQCCLILIEEWRSDHNCHVSSAAIEMFLKCIAVEWCKVSLLDQDKREAWIRRTSSIYPFYNCRSRRTALLHQPSVAWAHFMPRG